MRCWEGFLPVLLVASTAAAWAGGTDDSDTAAAWREDARSLARALTDLRRRVDWITPRDEFEWKADQTVRRVG